MKVRRNRLAPGMALRNHLFKQYVFQAKRRRIDFALTVSEFTEKAISPCFYCGQPPSQTVLGNTKRDRQYNGEFLHNGIDRVDNTVGYTPANTVPCCKTCNRAKDTMSVDDFLAWVFRVSNHCR